MRKPEDTIIKGDKAMKFVTHNDTHDIEVDGTHYVGEIRTKYDDLIAAFGKPTSGDGYKTDAEWEVRFANGMVATIYNWKDGHNYNDGDGMDVEDITNWHIGGRDERVVNMVTNVLVTKAMKKEVV